MITGSGGAVPSSSVTRPLTKIGCGIEGCWPWVVLVLVGVLEGVPRFVVVVLVVPVFPVPVGVVGVPVPPLFWPYAGTSSEEHTSELQAHSFITYAVFCLKK